MKLYDLDNLITGLKNVIDKELPIVTSYSITKNIYKVENEYKIFSEKKNKLLEKHSMKDSDGNIIRTGSGNVKIKDMEKFNRELEELLQIDCELDLIKIDIKDLGDINISPKSLMFLDPILNKQ